MTLASRSSWDHLNKLGRPHIPNATYQISRSLGKFGLHDPISLAEDYPLLYRTTRRILFGQFPPYCALPEYIVFVDLAATVIRKLLFLCGAELAPVSPIIQTLRVQSLTKRQEWQLARTPVPKLPHPPNIAKLRKNLIFKTFRH